MPETPHVWPDSTTERMMALDADLLAKSSYPVVCDAACHIRTLLSRVRELEGHRDILEAAIFRTRTAWVSAMELGIIQQRHHEGTESIVEELTAALAKVGSKETIR